MVFNTFAGRYPDIRVIFGHAGGTMPFLTERFEVRSKLGGYPRTLPDGPYPVPCHFHYDTAQASNPEAPGTLMKLVPPSQIVFGTDTRTGPARSTCATWPQWSLGPRTWPPSSPATLAA